MCKGLLSTGLTLLTFHFSLTQFAFSQTGFSRHTIDSNLGGAYWVYSADIDRDGDKDLVTAAGGGIDWWSNSGGSFSRRSVGSLSGAWSAYAADVDDDSDIDILGVSPTTDETILWVNNGGQSFSRVVVDATEQDPESVAAADFDGDGDMEIVVACWVSEHVTVFKNNGNNSFSKNIIDSGMPGAHTVQVGDFDRDGDMDVAACGATSTRWYRNSGSGSFSRNNIGGGALGIFAFDIDRDGDLDILQGDRSNGNIVWFRNNGGSFSGNTIESGYGDCWSLGAGDMDGDGDIDVAAAGFSADNVKVWWNSGSQSFNSSSIVDDVNTVRGVFVADYDRDGDDDIAAAIRGDGDLTWYEASGGGGDTGGGDTGGDDGGIATGGTLIEAEDMSLSGYSVEVQGGHYSANDGIKLSGSSGSAQVIFDGESGSYDVYIRYQDEDDGQSTLEVRIDGDEVDSWQLDIDDSDLHTRRVASGYSVNNGDLIEIRGVRNDGEFARVDYIQLGGDGGSGSGDTGGGDTGGNDGGVATGGTLIEAEDMSLSGYGVEVQGGHYSANDGIKLSSSSGTAQVIFDGESGSYDIYVRYQDEDDGQSTLEVRIDGNVVDSWRLDIDDSDLHTRQVASGHSISNGDLIEVRGVRDSGEFARVDYIQLGGDGGSGGGDTGGGDTGGNDGGVATGGTLVEAEDMSLSGYGIEEQGGHYSENDGIKLSSSSGTAQVIFGGESGSYDIYVRYQDEDDGQSTLEVSIDGNVVDSWRLDIDDSDLHTRQVASDYSVSNGDLIEIRGVRNGGEFARVDYIQLGGDGSSGGTGGDNNNDGGGTVAGLFVEAEDMSLNDFIVEDDKGSDYSEGAGIRLSDRNGTASVTFGGESGNYTLNVRYLDEDDGKSTVEIRVDGSLADSWSLDIDDNALHTRSIDVSIDSGSEVELTGRRDSGEFARIDYLEFVPDGLSKKAAAVTTALPAEFALRQNYPNPFNPSTTIEYTLPEASFVNLSIFNMKGQLIRQLVNGQEPAGQRQATWHGDDETGAAVSSGVYFARFEAGGHVFMKSMVLSR